MQICILFWSSPPDSSPRGSCCGVFAVTCPSRLRTLAQECMQRNGNGRCRTCCLGKSDGFCNLRLDEVKSSGRKGYRHIAPQNVQVTVLCRNCARTMALNWDRNPRREVVHQHTSRSERHITVRADEEQIRSLQSQFGTIEFRLVVRKSLRDDLPAESAHMLGAGSVLL